LAKKHFSWQAFSKSGLLFGFSGWPKCLNLAQQSKMILYQVFVSFDHSFDYPFTLLIEHSEFLKMVSKRQKSH